MVSHTNLFATIVARDLICTHPANAFGRALKGVLKASAGNGRDKLLRLAMVSFGLMAKLCMQVEPRIF